MVEAQKNIVCYIKSLSRDIRLRLHGKVILRSSFPQQHKKKRSKGNEAIGCHGSRFAEHFRGTSRRGLKNEGYRPAAVKNVAAVADAHKAQARKTAKTANLDDSPGRRVVVACLL